jgi:phosphohistidine phosphatase
MFIYLARHAWAGHYGDPAWPDDSLRPLTDDGMERYRRMMELMVTRGLEPSVIATSPLVRCRQTADIMAALTGASVVETEDLAPGLDLEGMIDWSNEQQGADVAWCGHNPDLELVLPQLLGDGTAHTRFAKGAIAAVAFDEEVAAGEGELHWLVTAKLVGV